MGKPTLLVLTTTYPRWDGDTEPPFVHKLCTHLLQDFRVLVLAPHAAAAKTEEELDGVTVYRYRYWLERWQALAYRGGLVANLKSNKWRLLQLPLLLLAQMHAIRRIVRREPVAVIHAHWIIPQGLAVRLALLGLQQQPRLVCTSHGGDLLGFDGALLRSIKRWVLRRAAALTTVSQLIASKAQELGVSEQMLHVIPMGIATSQMQTQADVTRADGEILFVGRMVEKKGLPYLLDAMALLKARLPHARLTLVGDGPLRQALQARCQELQLQDRVRFVGALANDQLAAQYSRATVFVAPSVVTAEGDQEGLPVTIIEALACHCPVAASALGGIAEVIENEVSGLLVPPGDAQALAAALERLLNDGGLRARLVHAGFAQVHERFDWVSVARQHVAVLLPWLQGMGTQKVCAVVVAYFPDTHFELRLQRILPQVAKLVLVDNTPESVALSPSFLNMWSERLHYIANAENKGIATALNQGLRHAAEHGFDWLLTLDQDSTCYPDMVATLSAAYIACPLVPAILGSNYFDPSNQKCKVPPEGAQPWLEQKTVITSGCLLNVVAMQHIGGLRDDYFIDQVDHELCLRARAHGLRVAITRKPVMAHSVGLTGGVRLPWLGVLPNHSPTRKYYIARNTVVTVLRYWHAEPIWCLKRVLKLLLGSFEMVTLETQRLNNAAAFICGVVDACRGRMGPREFTRSH